MDAVPKHTPVRVTQLGNAHSALNRTPEQPVRACPQRGSGAPVSFVTTLTAQRDKPCFKAAKAAGPCARSSAKCLILNAQKSGTEMAKPLSVWA